MVGDLVARDCCVLHEPEIVVCTREIPNRKRSVLEKPNQGES
ncbi:MULTISPECIES: hypothetical protein [Metallosphaera]|nr:hypothetical protein [Metallosphaera sedula]